MSYPARLRAVSEYLNSQIHPHVEKGTLISKEGFLTDHGPGHIATVVERASDLLACSDSNYPQLTPYEVYLLLMAIQFHDVGNLYGREGHERKIDSVMEHMGKLVGDEMVEKVAIRKIAAAHGGWRNGNRDTIMQLPSYDFILSRRVGYQALAAILRFADELSDDSGRAARAVVELGRIPDVSRLFHMYSESLHSVRVDPDAHVVYLRYYLTRDKAGPISSGESTRFLLDEIYERTLKMHYEREYCMRFIRGLVYIDAIDVRIDVYESSRSLNTRVDPIAYRLQQVGYPGERREEIKDLVAGGEIPPHGIDVYNLLSRGEAV